MRGYGIGNTSCFSEPALGMDQTYKTIIAIWDSPGRPPLTEGDAREIVNNLVGFFSVLEQWRQQDAVSEGDPQ